MEDKTIKNLIKILLVITIVFLLTKIQSILNPVLGIVGMIITPVILGGFLYYVLRPLKKLIRKFIKNDGAASLITILIVIILIVIILIAGGGVVAEQFEDVFVKNKDKLLNFKDSFDGGFQDVLPDLNILEKVNDNLKSFATSIFSNAAGVFSSVGDLTTQFILIPFLLFFLLKDDSYFKEKLMSLIPRNYKTEIKDMLTKSDKVLATYINGQMLVAVFLGSFMFIGYLIIGMPSALLMGVFSLITAVIPILGAFLGILPAILIALTVDFALVVKVIIVAIIAQQLESNVVTPKIMGNKLNLHPLGVIIIIIVSLKLLGILGPLIGIPLFLVSVIVFKTMIEINKKRKKALTGKNR